MTDRAILFVDGNNWFHALRRNRIGALAELDYAKISLKLAGPRRWVETRYYIGALQQQRDPRAYAEQRRFLSGLEGTDTRIKVLRGRLEPRPESTPSRWNWARGWMETRPACRRTRRLRLGAWRTGTRTWWRYGKRQST